MAVLYGLVVLGGVVTSADAGMGCGPHWPLCAGRFLPPPTVTGVLEYSHRLVAGVVSVLTVALAIRLWRWRPQVAPAGRARRLALGLVGILALQVVLGGLVVLTGIPPWLIALHAGNALLLLDVALAAALWLTPAAAGGRTPVPARMRAALWGLAVWAGVTVMLGSYLAHSGVSCTGFAACLAGFAHAGGGVGAGLAHWVAALLLGGGLALALRERRALPSGPRRWLWWSAVGFCCQAVLGPLLLLTGGASVLLSLHEAVGMATAASLCGAASTAGLPAPGPVARSLGPAGEQAAR